MQGSEGVMMPTGGKGLYACCHKPITEFMVGSLHDEYGNCYKGEFEEFVRHGAGILELNDGNTIVGHFCNGLLQGKATFVAGTQLLKICDFLPVAPFDSRVLKLISRADGCFVKGVATG